MLDRHDGNKSDNAFACWPAMPAQTKAKGRDGVGADAEKRQKHVQEEEEKEGAEQREQ